MDYLTTKEAAELWGVTIRQVQSLCDLGKIPGAQRFGNAWMVPKDTPKPIDGRTKAARALRKKAEGK
jgi:excisionase family DNA binding protein